MVSLKLNIFVINLLKVLSSLNSLDIWNAYKDNFSTSTHTEGAAGKKKAFSNVFCSTLPQRTGHLFIRYQHQVPHKLNKSFSDSSMRSPYLLRTVKSYTASSKVWAQQVTRTGPFSCERKPTVLFPKSGNGRNGSCQLDAAKKSQPWAHSAEALPPKKENCCSRHYNEIDLQCWHNILITRVQDKNKPMMGTNEETSGENRAQPLAGD